MSVVEHELGDLEWEYERHLKKWSSSPYVDYDFEAYTKEENIIFYDPVGEGYAMLLKPQTPVVRIRDKYECVERFRSFSIHTRRFEYSGCKRKIKVESKEVVVFKDLYFQREERVFTEKTGWVEVYVYDFKPIKKEPTPAKIAMKMKELRAEIKALKKKITEDKERQKKEYELKHKSYKIKRREWRFCYFKNREIRSENSQIRQVNERVRMCKKNILKHTASVQNKSDI